MDLDFKDVARFTLSANEIRQYCECPRKRYYASRDCLAIRSSAINKNLELGRAIHLTLQYYYTEGDRLIKESQLEDHPTKEQVEDIMKNVAPFELTDEATLDIGDVQIYNCLIEQYLPTIIDDLAQYSIEGCEVSFNMLNWPINDVRYHGSIDMVVRDRETNKVWFFEHKTCRDFRPPIYDRFDIQLHIYDAYGFKEYGDEFGGMILNQLKKAKTFRGYGLSRIPYSYNETERNDFFNWISNKTKGLVSPSNFHEPCNNYMSCKMCEYGPICMKFGYQVPKTTQEVVEDPDFVNEVVDPETEEITYVKGYTYNPRESHDEAE